MAVLTHWHILGAGSMGCLWAFYLQQAGHTVTLVCKDEHQQQQLQAAQPLTLLYQGKTFTSEGINIVTCQQLCTSSPVQHLLVCLKAWQTPAAIAAIKYRLAPGATVVLMQNGMGNQQLLLKQFPECANYAAITTEAACKRAIFTVEHTGRGNTQVGMLGSIKDKAIVDKLHCDIAITMNPDITAALWQKLVINCCINPLTVIYRCNNGALANNSEAQATIKTIISECRAVANAVGTGPYLDNIEKTVADVIEKTALNTSSMLQDVLQLRPTEIDFINGYIYRTGQHYGIATPVNLRITDSIKSISTI